MLRKEANQHTARVTMLTPNQLRAARALVDWTREELAAKSGVSRNTVKGFERNGSDPKLSTLHKWRRALEAAGVMFIDPDEQNGAGVRLRGARGKR
jgi:transcriptional regulator with XRE-family HTH domain